MPSNDRNAAAPVGAIADRRAQRTDQILRAAWAVAAESGLAAVSLHEVARRVGIKQPSLYGYVSSKLDLFDAMFAQAYGQLLERLDATPPTGSAREQLVRLSRVLLDFIVEDPPRQQLIFQRTIPGFEPSEQSCALAKRVIDRFASLLAALDVGRPAHLDIFTALLGGLAAQQVANDPGGDRYARHLEDVLDMFLDHFTHPTSRPGIKEST